MTDPILSRAEAKRSFFIYLGVRCGGLALLVAAFMLSRGGITITSGVLVALGIASLFVRPRMLGLTPKREP